MMKKKKKLSKQGTKVYHKIHGPGEVIGPTEDPAGVMVRFDHPILQWGTDTLEVSSSLLTKRWGKMVLPKKQHEGELNNPKI